MKKVLKKWDKAARSALEIERHPSPDGRVPVGTRLVICALCLMTCAVPLVLLPGLYDYVFVPKLLTLHLCVALACLGWLVPTRWERNARLVSSPLLLPTLGFMSVALLSSPATTHPLDTFVELINQAVLFALFFVTAHALSSKDLSPILWTNGLTGLAVSLIGILQYHGITSFGIPTSAPPSATFAHRNFAGEYLICAMPLTILLFLTSRRRLAIFASGLSGALMGVYLVYTRSRACWVGAGGALTVLALLVILRPSLRRTFWEALLPGLVRRKGLAALGFGVVFLALSILPPKFRDIGWQSNYYTKASISSTVFSIAEKGSDKGRLAMWKNTLHMIGDNPLLGVGSGGWIRVYPLYDRGKSMVSDNISPESPHNDYVWIASEYGLIGLVVYAWLLLAAFGCLRTMYRSTEHGTRIAAMMFALSLLSILIEAFFGFPRACPQAVMYPYLLFGLIAAWTSDGNSGGGFLSISRFTVRLIPFLMLLICLAAVTVSWFRIGFERHYLRALASGKYRGDWATAVIESRRARQVGVFRPHILHLEGNALENLGRYAEAEIAYRQALVYAPNSWQDLNGLGSVCMKQGRIDEALIHIRAALSIVPQYLEARISMGLALAAKEDLDGAIREYQGALKLNPGMAETYSNLGSARMGLGDLEGAIREYLQALKLKPDLAQTHNDLGLAYKRRGDLDEAILEYRQALKLKPDYTEAHNNLGVGLMGKGNLDGAIHEWQQALAIKPDHAETHNNLGLGFAAKGDWSSAIHEYRRAIALKPDLARAYGNLGIALQAMGDRAGAIEAFRVCLRLSTDEESKKWVRNLIAKLGDTP